MDRTAATQMVKRDFETGIVLLVGVAVAAAALLTWRDIGSDRAVTVAQSRRLAATLASGTEDHFDATMRDATNAAMSAAILVENAGGMAAVTNEQKIHAELKRELWDERSTARLLLLDAQDRLVASSAEYPVGSGALVPHGTSWPVPIAGGREFRIGSPGRSPIDNEFVIPYWCDVMDREGRRTGSVRAELRLSYFVNALASVADLYRGVVIIASPDGTGLIRVPHRDEWVGEKSPGLVRFANSANAPVGLVPGYKSARDGVTRDFSWRKMARMPMYVIIGIEEDAVLAPWRERAVARVTILVVGCAGFAILGFLLVRHLRRLAASELRVLETEGRYWRAMESSSIGVAIARLDGQWEHVNPALCRMLGYSEHALLAMHPVKLVAPEYRGDAARLLGELATQKTDHVSVEICLLHRSGREIWVHVQSALMPGVLKPQAAVIAHVQDITDRRNAELQLRTLNHELEHRVAERTAELSRVNKDLEAFSYSAAHDLRGPLARMMASLDVLARELGALPPGALSRLQAVRGQATEMTALIDQLLALGRSARGTLSRQRVPLSSLVEEIVADLEPACAGRDVRWIVGPLPVVAGDRGLLREALSNLLGNALKYTRGRDTAIIEVGSESGAESGQARIFVRDNGAGFDMARAGELFAPFKRLHTASEFEGTGVGLAIVQRIIERSGGHIEAEAAPGRGATFRFTLPLDATQESPAAEQGLAV